MKYIKSFADTSTMNAFIENISEEGCYLLRDESKEGKDSIKSYKYVFTGLTMTSTGNSTVKFITQQTDIQYKINAGEWTDYVSNTTLNLSNGDKLCWLRNGNTKITGRTVGSFSMTGSIAASGILYSIISNEYETLTNLTGWGGTYDGIFKNIFSNCNVLTSAPELPATTLTNECYAYMFNNCGSLTSAPKLPATSLVKSCYSNMFNNCRSLTSAPELPATTLGDNCYSNMFNNCSSLTTAPVLPATTLKSECYGYMFSYCSALTSAPELPATTLQSGCYLSMFKNCTALTSAPELPANNLVFWCYNEMFKGCSSLNNVKCYATNISGINSLENWLSGVSSTGDFYKDANTTYPEGDSGIPSGWTIHNI